MSPGPSQSLFLPTTALNGRTALVTGASRGIGRAIAARLQQAGAQVILCGRSPDDLRQVADELGAGVVSLAFDVSSRVAVDHAISELLRSRSGGVDIVVNNAGRSAMTPIDGDDDSEWHALLATNLSAPMYVTRACLPFMSAGGSVINISSVLGKLGVPGKGAYCASKHGLIGWTRAVALELAPRRIRVNVVCPGWVETEMAKQSVAENAQFDGVDAAAWRARAESDVPLQRFLAPAEVAELVAFLAAPAAAGITGEVFTISAGATPF